MATYVPGSETYLPDIKPFTPDYKFLSAVLDVRQDKYNTNWQATNDVYNKVVFADLSREDTNDKREQYVNNLAPSLEKIASMDLSLAQNAQSAKAVFAPFFEDKLIVKDMVKTANYRKEMAHAERLEQSPDHLRRSMYWRDGVAKLQYDMEDFINMDADAAIKAPLQKYVPKANLHELSNEILGGLEPPLQITNDVPMYNIDGSVNPDWIVTEKNGSQVEGPALQILRKQLSNDPRVIASYDTQAYVLGRDFAAEGMQAGTFNTVQEGQSAWAQETIQRIAQNNALILNGTTNYVAFAKESDFILVSCKHNNKIKLILINSKSPGIKFSKLITTTGEYQYRIDFLNAKINQDLLLSELSSPDDKILTWLINRMIIGICSFALGVNEASLKLTASYTSQRNAFKKPIASFQAVRHKTADCYIDIACLRVVTEQAISSLILKKEAEKEVAIAKIWCGDICHRISYACQHLHGGIGIDKDYSLYKYNLWAKQLELSFGSSKFHLRKLGKLIAKN